MAIKFADPELSRLLEATGDALLVDSTVTHDQHWSDCYCAEHRDEPGGNHLGRMLMELRAHRRQEAPNRWPRASVVADNTLDGSSLQFVHDQVHRVLRKLRVEHGTNTLISGLRAAADVEVADIASQAEGYRLWAYLLFPDTVMARRTQDWRRRDNIRGRAVRTVTLSEKRPGDRKRALRLASGRDRLAVRDASVLIAIYDLASDGQLVEIVDGARLSGLPIVTIDPVARLVTVSERRG